MAGEFKFTFGPWNIHEGADPFGPTVRKTVEFGKKLKMYKTLGFDFDAYPFTEVAHKFVDSYMSEYHSCQLHPSAREILKTTRDLFPCQSILSATDQESLNEMVTHFQLETYFDHWYGIADKLAASKIERGFELMAQAGYSKDETVLIGDTDHDIDVGQELGIEVLLVAHGHHSFDRLADKHRPDKVLPTFF